MGVQRPGRRGDDCIASMVLANLQKISRSCYATRGLAAVLRLAQPGLILLLCGLPHLHSHGRKKAIEQKIAAKRNLIPASKFAPHEKRGAAFRSARRRQYPSLLVSLIHFPIATFHSGAPRSIVGESCLGDRYNGLSSPCGPLRSPCSLSGHFVA